MSRGITGKLSSEEHEHERTGNSQSPWSVRLKEGSSVLTHIQTEKWTPDLSADRELLLSRCIRPSCFPATTDTLATIRKERSIPTGLLWPTDCREPCSLLLFLFPFFWFLFYRGDVPISWRTVRLKPSRDEIETAHSVRDLHEKDVSKKKGTYNGIIIRGYRRTFTNVKVQYHAYNAC